MASNVVFSTESNMGKWGFELWIPFTVVQSTNHQTKCQTGSLVVNTCDQSYTRKL